MFNEKAIGPISYRVKIKNLFLHQHCTFLLEKDLKFLGTADIPTTSRGSTFWLEQLILGQVLHHHHELQPADHSNLKIQVNLENTHPQVGIHKALWYYSCFESRA